MRNNSRKNYRRRRRNTRASQIKLVGIVAVIVVIAIIIVISCFNKTKKDSNKAKDTGTATENVTGVTEQVSETEEAKELFAPKESDATAAIGDELESSYAVVIDEQDGTVVAGKNAHEKMYPASMTKVMTVLVAAEQAEKNAIAAAENENTEIDRQAVIENKLNEVVTITREATDYSYVHDCSTTGFLDGEQVPLRDVFNGTILPSGGESAYQLAVYTAGSMEAFVDMMNQKAAELGIGIMQAAMEDDICKTVLSNHTYSTAATPQHPENLNISNLFLRRIEDKMTSGEVIGAKTGFVNQSGNCAVSYEKAASGKTYICVTAGASSGWHCIDNHVYLYNTYGK